MRFKCYEHFYSNTLSSQNDARQTLATVLHNRGLDNIKNSLIQIAHNVQALWGFSLNDHIRLDNCSANICLSKKVVSHASGLGILICIFMQNVIKVYHVVQEIWTFSLTGNEWWTDGRTRTMIIVQTQGSCSTSFRSTYYIKLILSL